MLLQPPVNITPPSQLGCADCGNCGCGNKDGGLGGAGDCSPVTSAFLGALAAYIIPPIVGGLISGMREEYQSQRGSRKRR